MPYVEPTVQDLKTRFPEFSQVADEVLQAALGEAAGRVDETWREADFATARILYAAHVLVGQGLGSGREAKFAGLNAAGISQIKISSLSVSMAKDGAYAREPVRAGELRSTSYGVRFLALLKLNHPGPVVANGHP